MLNFLHLVFKVDLVKMENFVNAPHTQEVDTQNAKEENNCKRYTHITLESERVCCGLWPTEQHCV